MENRIKQIVRTLKNKGTHITVENIITESLFTNGGTLAGYEDEIREYLWKIRENISKKIQSKYNGGIDGFDVALVVNDWFNEPNTKKFLSGL